LAGAVIQYGLPQVQPDQIEWSQAVTVLDERFPRQFLERHSRLSRQDCDVLWCYMDKPEQSEHAVAETLGIKASAVDQSTRFIRREWDCRRTAIAVWRASDEVNEIRVSVHDPVRDSVRTSVDQRQRTG